MERQAFEQHFLKSGAARKKLEEARVVAEYFRRSNRRSRVNQLVMVAAMILVCAFIAYFAYDAGIAAKGEIEIASNGSAPDQHPDRKGGDGAEPVMSGGDSQATTALRLTATLTPGRQRDPDDEASTIRLPAGTALLRLRLDTTHLCQPNRCRAELRFNAGPPTVILPVQATPSGLSVELPTSYFPQRADCLLELKDGTSLAESFQFSLETISPAIATP